MNHRPAPCLHAERRQRTAPPEVHPQGRATGDKAVVDTLESILVKDFMSTYYYKADRKATPATLHDTITITVSPEYHVLVATGYSASEYPPYKDFINVGDIHSCEPWLYSECLAKNIAVRAAEWRKQNSSNTTPTTKQLTL